MSYEQSIAALTRQQLICLGLIAASSGVTRSDLDSFLGPFQAIEIQNLIRDELIEESRGVLNVAPGLEIASVLGALDRGQRDTDETFREKVEQWHHWMLELCRFDVVIRLIPWLPPSPDSESILLEHGRSLLDRDAKAVLEAISSMTRCHPMPLCPALKALLGYALSADGREHESLRCLSSLIDSTSILDVPLCGHELSALEAASLELWVMQRRPAELDDAVVQAIVKNWNAILTQKSASKNEFEFAKELFFTQCQLTDFLGAKESLERIQEIARRTSLQEVRLMMHALCAHLACVSGHMRLARSHATAVLAGANEAGALQAVQIAHTVLAWAALTDSEPDLRRHIEAGESGHMAPPIARAFLSVAGILSLVESEGLESAREQIEARLSNLPSNTSATDAFRLTTSADLAWMANDLDELHRCFRLIQAESAPAEAALVYARLQLMGPNADGALRAAVAVSKRSLLPFTDLRVLVTSAERLWLTGKVAEADAALEQVAATAERRFAIRFVREMLFRRPDWAEHLNLIHVSAGKETPRWLSPIPMARSGGRPVPNPKQVAQGDIRPLSPAETRVMALVGLGLTSAEMAARLNLSFNTVRAHQKTIYHKLGVHKRSEAIAAGRALGYL